MDHLKLTDIARHRNGINGAPFHILTFEDDGEKMIGFVFEEPGHVAVVNYNKLPNIAFGENSYRGDIYEKWLREKVEEYQNCPY